MAQVLVESQATALAGLLRVCDITRTVQMSGRGLGVQPMMGLKSLRRDSGDGLSEVAQVSGREIAVVMRARGW